MLRAIAVSLVCGLAAGAVVTAQDGPQVFRSGTDLVHFGVTVLDRQGNLHTNLTADDFEIVEDGRPQSIKFFARGGDEISAPALHLGLCFDTSGSMNQDLALSRSAAIKFLNTLTHAVDMTVVDFDTEVRVARYSQADFPRLVERLRKRAADGFTALYDAIGVYVDGASFDDGRKILVLYTDGGDTRSTMTLADTVNALKGSDVTVYAVGFLEHQSQTTRMTQRMVLQQLAEVTGGQAWFPSDIKSLDSAYEKVRDEIAAQYSLGYSPADGRDDGSWRKVEIRVKRPDLKGAKIRTRKGYFAPAKADLAKTEASASRPRP